MKGHQNLDLELQNQQIAQDQRKRGASNTDLSFLELNAEDDISFYSVNKDPNGDLLANLAASQQKHNETMSSQIHKMREVRQALNKRVPTAKSVVRTKAYKCDPSILPFASAYEQQKSEEGYLRLLDNFDKHHTERLRKRPQSQQPRLQNETDDDEPREVTLLFEKFQVNYPIKNINEKEYINPAYYDTEAGLDLRAPGKSKRKSAQVEYGNSMILSAFNNPDTQVVLKKSSNDNKQTVYMNTRSFAVKCGRLAPKHKVKRVTKEHHDMPDVGFYDVKTSLQNYRVRNVQMDKDLPRSENIFLKGKKTDENQTTDRPTVNYWTNNHVKQGHLEYKTQLGRDECTKKQGERGGGWLFQKTHNEVLKEEQAEKLRELAVEKALIKNNDAFDDRTEHKEKKFTCDLSKIGSVKAHYLNGLEKAKENIKKALGSQE